MFAYQKNFSNPTLPVDEAQFWALVRATQWNENIDKYRETGDAQLKRKLPAFIFQATFDETESKAGKLGCWRKQAATRLTGLVVMDVDHVEDPKAVFEGWGETELRNHGVLLVYVTPSGKGLKIVFKADVKNGNLIDNQHAMAKVLGVEVDESCKDASRMSFICKETDILYLDKELFTYENKEFGEKYDALYRDGHSAAERTNTEQVLTNTNCTNQTNGCAEKKDSSDSIDSCSEKKFKGIPYSEIISEWWKLNGGEPQEGERNVKLYQLAVNLRAICDNNRELLLEIMPRLGLDEQELHSIVAADKIGKEAINAYREQMRTKGANKEKPKKPKVVVRIHPARTSNAQFIQDMVNAVEDVNGEPMQLHMLTFDTELDNTLSLQKGGAYIDKQALQLKAFHNEEDGQAYSNVDSVFQEFYVIWNFIYTGTPIALKKMVNEQNFGSGLATRLTCIPLPATNFEMMSRESFVDYDSDERLKAWAEKLDRMKGELSVQKIVDELYDWTARRMEDAKENDSKADEMLLKRCAYHGLNFAAPFIVMRHWDQMKQDGQYWCGEFETDEVDWRLAELITNIQFACQRHYFGAMAENYFDNKLKDASVNVQRRQKTYEGFSRLPEVFTTDDVMRCFQLKNVSAAYMRISRLQRDHLIEKDEDFVDGGTTKSRYRKTGVLMC